MTSVTLFWCLFVNFEHISHFFLVLQLLTLNRQKFVGEIMLTILPGNNNLNYGKMLFVNFKQSKCAMISSIPVDSYMIKVSNINTRTSCEMRSKLTIKTPKQHHCRRSGVFIDNFEHNSHLVLVFLLLTLSR